MSKSVDPAAVILRQLTFTMPLSRRIFGIFTENDNNDII